MYVMKYKCLCGGVRALAVVQSAVLPVCVAQSEWGIFTVFYIQTHQVSECPSYNKPGVTEWVAVHVPWNPIKGRHKCPRH